MTNDSKVYYFAYPQGGDPKTWQDVVCHFDVFKSGRRLHIMDTGEFGTAPEMQARMEERGFDAAYSYTLTDVYTQDAGLRAEAEARALAICDPEYARTMRDLAGVREGIARLHGLTIAGAGIG